MCHREPSRYAEIAGCVARAPASCAVGDEEFTVTVVRGRVRVRAGIVQPTPAIIETSPSAVLELFDGAATLEALLADESLVVRARPDALLELSRALSVFGAAASSSPEFSRQFEEYRAWVLSRPGR